MSSTNRHLVRLAISCAALVPASAGLAAAASAATLSADKACYVNINPAQGAQMVITGSGFTPQGTVDLSGGTVFATAVADPAGNVAFSTAAPTLATFDAGQTSTVLTATDEATGAPSAPLTVLSANLAVSTKPASVKNVRKDPVMFSFSGFTPGKHIYGFYARKKIVAKARFGKASGPCGTLRQRALLYPGGRPHNDQYKVTFEDSAKYSKKAFPIVTGTLNILRF